MGAPRCSVWWDHTRSLAFRLQNATKYYAKVRKTDSLYCGLPITSKPWVKGSDFKFQPYGRLVMEWAGEGFAHLDHRCGDVFVTTTLPPFCRTFWCGPKVAGSNSPNSAKHDEETAIMLLLKRRRAQFVFTPASLPTPVTLSVGSTVSMYCLRDCVIVLSV